MWFQYRLRSQAYESGSLEYGRTDAATSAEGGDVRGGAPYGDLWVVRMACMICSLTALEIRVCRRIFA